MVIICSFLHLFRYTCSFTKEHDISGEKNLGKINEKRQRLVVCFQRWIVFLIVVIVAITGLLKEASNRRDH